jgi:hypothetical protein
MAYATVLMSNGVEIKKAPIGFSWTTFFFGGWVGLLRQDWLKGSIILVGGLCTYGIVGVVAAFFYNKLYIKGLFDQGYRVHAYPPNVNEETLRIYCEYVALPGAKVPADKSVAV